VVSEPSQAASQGWLCLGAQLTLGLSRKEAAVPDEGLTASPRGSHFASARGAGTGQSFCEKGAQFTKSLKW